MLALLASEVTSAHKAIDFRFLFVYALSMSGDVFAPAWVVTCHGCGCVIVCRALDRQWEHSSPENVEPHPGKAVVLTCCCCWKTFRYLPDHIYKDSPKPSDDCPERRQRGAIATGRKKSDGALLIAACIIAAVRLNKHEIKPSPALTAKVADSIKLAEIIQETLLK
ncbi:MAG TPA: hypothetical protein VHA33_05725 [Candidatus Angelobacter sp.]|jgi:hypothetical protein|nr:hypothetical protein [Candidatus Angelobacter sp.]